MEDLLQFENKLNNIDNKIFSLTKRKGGGVLYCFGEIKQVNKFQR